MKISIKKVLSVLVTACFVLTSIGGQAAASVADNARATQQYKQIFADFMLPYSYGKITDAHFASTDRVIINIQDLHCHPKVQKNISNIIDLFDKKYGVKTVYLEGAYGDVDTSWITKTGDSNYRNIILEKMIDTGRLTGAEYFSAVSGKTGIIKGLEKKEPYLENLKRFGDILENKEKIELILKSIDKSTRDLKVKYYDRRQFKLEQLSKDYANGKINSEKYFILLSKHIEKLGIDIYKYDNTLTYMNLLGLQKNLKYTEITKELQNLVLLLKGKLPFNAYKMLLDSTDNFAQTDKLYGYIVKMTREYNLDLSVNFPELNKYFGYVELSQKINPLDLIKEEKDLINEINTRFSSTKAQRDVVFMAKFEKYLGDYLTSKITKDDYEYYNANIAKYRQLWDKYVDNRVLHMLDGYMAEADKFYRINTDRNEYFTENITEGVVTGKIDAEISSSGEINKILENMSGVKRVDVIITGGFHTTSISDILDNQNVSYIVITPNVTDGTKYAEQTYYRIVKEQSKISFQALANLIASLSPIDQMKILNTVDPEGLRNSQYYKQNREQVEKILGQEGMLSQSQTDSIKELLQFIGYSSILESDDKGNVSEQIINLIKENLGKNSILSGQVDEDLLKYIDVEKLSKALKEMTGAEEVIKQALAKKEFERSGALKQSLMAIENIIAGVRDIIEKQQILLISEVKKSNNVAAGSALITSLQKKLSAKIISIIFKIVGKIDNYSEKSGSYIANFKKYIESLGWEFDPGTADVVYSGYKGNKYKDGGAPQIKEIVINKEIIDARNDAAKHSIFKLVENVRGESGKAVFKISYYEIPQDDSSISGYDMLRAVNDGKYKPFLVMQDQYLLTPSRNLKEILKKDKNAEEQKLIDLLYDPAYGIYVCQKIDTEEGKSKFIISSVDLHVDSGVWGTMIDTVIAASMLSQLKGKFPNVMELGSGAGHISAAIAQLPGVENVYFTDISPFALALSKANIAANNPDTDLESLHPILGPGVPESGVLFDLLVANPPYVDEPPNLRGEMDLTAYGGTKFLREILERLTRYLNGNNPDAQAILSVSSTTRQALERYLSELGYDFIFEQVGESKRVPFKVYKVLGNEQWINWLAEEGMVYPNPGYQERGEEPYYHDLTVYRVRLRTSQVKAEDAQNAKAAALERFRNLNPTRGPSITDEEFDGALNEAFGSNSQAKTKFLNDLAFEGSIKYQIWHTYLSNIPNITLAQQIKLLAAVIKIVEAGNYNQKAISIDLRGLENAEDSSYLQYLLNQSIDDISLKLSTKTDNGAIKVFTSLANKKFKKAQECVSLLKELKISLPELTGVLIELIDEDISNIDLDAKTLKKKITKKIRKTGKKAREPNALKTEFKYEDIENMRIYNSWTRKYQEYIAAIINAEMDKPSGTKEDKINNLIEIFGGYKNLDSMQATALFNLYRENGSFASLIKLYENVGEYAVEFKESLAIKEFYFVAFNKTKNFETTIEKLSDSSQEKNGELYGSLGKAYYERYKRLKKEYAYGKTPQLLEQMKQALKDSYDAYNDGYLLDYYYYPGINAVYRAIELAELETDETQKKHWQDKAEDLAELVYLSTEKAGGIRSGDYWTLITMVEAMAISGKYADTAEFAKMQNILNKALEFVTAGWEVDSTLSNLEPLLNRKQDTPYAENLEAIVNRLYLKKLELLIPAFDANQTKLEKTDKNDPKYESVKAEYENILKQIKEAMSNNPARTYNEEEIIDIIGLLLQSRYYGLLKNELKQNISEEIFTRLEKESKAKKRAETADKKTTKAAKFTKALLAFCYRFPVFSLDIFQTKSISGNYQYGGGLQEMMLGREDIKIAEQIIKDLDLEDTDDIDVFMARIDELIRRQFRNDELHLEDLKSEGHGRFDDSIKAIQELTASGRTTDSRTNIMLDFLLGIGDCRQHGETKQILFEVWKEMRIKGHFVDARTAIDNGDMQVAATSFEKIRQLLKKQMFTMEALVTGNVAMNGKYNVFKDKDGNPIKSDKVNDIEEHVLTVLVELDDEGNVVMDKDGNFVNGSFRLADAFYQHEYKFGWGQLDIKAEDCSVGEDGKLTIKAGTTENGLDIFLTEPKVEYAGHESRVESRSKKGKLNNVFGLLYRGLPSVTSLLSRMFDVRKEYIAGHAIELIRSKNKSDDSALRKSFDLFSSSLLQYYRNIVKKLDRSVFDGIIKGLKEFLEIKDNSTIQITDEMLSKYAIAGLPAFETFIKELNLNPEQSLKLAEVFHTYGYYENIRKNEIGNPNSPVIDTRFLDSNFNPKAEQLLSCLTDQAREVIEKRHRRSAREKIKLTIFDIKDSKMAEFFELAGKSRPDSLIEARKYIDKNAKSWYEAGYLSESGRKKIEAGNTNLTKNDFTKDGFENIDKSIIKEAETPVVNTLQVPWEYLQQDIGKYEVLNQKGEWLRKESLQKQEERKQFLIEQQTSGVVVTIATLMYLKNHNITDGLLALKLIHAGWSVNNKWDLLAKAHYDDLSVEEKRKDLIYLEAVSKFLLFDQDPVIAKMLESAKESLSIEGTFGTIDSSPAVILAQSGTKQATNAIKLASKDGEIIPVEIDTINDLREAIDWSSRHGFNELTIVIGAIDAEGITDKTSDEQRLAWLNKILKLTTSQNNKDLRDYALSKGISLSIHCFSFTKDVVINGEHKQILPTPGFDKNWAQMHELQLQIAESLGIKSVVVHAINDLSDTNVDAWVRFVKSAGAKGITVNFENDFKYIAPTEELFDKSRIAGYIGFEAFIEFLDKLKSKLNAEERQFLGVTLDTTKALSSFTSAAQSKDEKIKNLTFENLMKYINAVLQAGYKINIVHLSQFDTSKEMPLAKDTENGTEFEIAYNKSGIYNQGIITADNLKVLLEVLKRQNPQIVILQETQTDVVPMKGSAKLELPSAGKFLDKLGITQEKNPKLRALLAALIEAPIIALSAFVPSVKNKFFKAHNFDVSVESIVKASLDSIVKISLAGTLIGTAVGIVSIITFILNPVSSILFLGLFTDLAIVIGSTVVPHMIWNIQNPSMRLELDDSELTKEELDQERKIIELAKAEIFKDLFGDLKVDERYLNYFSVRMDSGISTYYVESYRNWYRRSNLKNFNKLKETLEQIKWISREDIKILLAMMGYTGKYESKVGSFIASNDTMWDKFSISDIVGQSKKMKDEVKPELTSSIRIFELSGANDVEIEQKNKLKDEIKSDILNDMFGDLEVEKKYLDYFSVSIDKLINMYSNFDRAWSRYKKGANLDDIKREIKRDTIKNMVTNYERPDWNIRLFLVLRGYDTESGGIWDVIQQREETYDSIKNIIRDAEKKKPLTKEELERESVIKAAIRTKVLKYMFGDNKVKKEDLDYFGRIIDENFSHDWKGFNSEKSRAIINEKGANLDSLIEYEVKRMEEDCKFITEKDLDILLTILGYDKETKEIRDLIRYIHSERRMTIKAIKIRLPEALKQEEKIKLAVRTRILRDMFGDLKVEEKDLGTLNETINKGIESHFSITDVFNMRDKSSRLGELSSGVELSTYVTKEEIKTFFTILGYRVRYDYVARGFSYTIRTIGDMIDCVENMVPLTAEELKQEKEFKETIKSKIFKDMFGDLKVAKKYLDDFSYVIDKEIEGYFSWRSYAERRAYLTETGADLEQSIAWIAKHMEGKSLIDRENIETFLTIMGYDVETLEMKEFIRELVGGAAYVEDIPTTVEKAVPISDVIKKAKKIIPLTEEELKQEKNIKAEIKSKILKDMFGDLKAEGEDFDYLSRGVDREIEYYFLRISYSDRKAILAKMGTDLEETITWITTHIEDTRWFGSGDFKRFLTLMGHDIKDPKIRNLINDMPVEMSISEMLQKSENIIPLTEEELKQEKNIKAEIKSKVLKDMFGDLKAEDKDFNYFSGLVDEEVKDYFLRTSYSKRKAILAKIGTESDEMATIVKIVSARVTKIINVGQNTKLELPSAGRFLDKLGITQEKHPKLRALLAALIEAPIIALSAFVPSVKDKFFKAHNFDVSVENIVKVSLDSIVKISLAGTLIGTAVGIVSIITFILNPVSSILFLGLFTDLAIVIGSTVVPHMIWNIQNPSMRLEFVINLIKQIFTRDSSKIKMPIVEIPIEDGDNNILAVGLADGNSYEFKIESSGRFHAMYLANKNGKTTQMSYSDLFVSKDTEKLLGIKVQIRENGKWVDLTKKASQYRADKLRIIPSARFKKGTKVSIEKPNAIQANQADPGISGLADEKNKKEAEFKKELNALIFKDMLGEEKISDEIRFYFENILTVLIYEYFDNMSSSERRISLTKTGNELDKLRAKIVKEIERKVFSDKKDLRTFLIARGYDVTSQDIRAKLDDIINGGKNFTVKEILQIIEPVKSAKMGLPIVAQVKNTLNPVGKVQKTAITIVIGRQALEMLQKEEFNTKEVMLVINDSSKAEELRQEGLNVATAVAVQKKEKAKLKGSKKIGTAGTYNGAVVRAYWNSESKELMFYSKSGLDGADIEQLKEMFANMQTEGLKSEAFKGINQIVVTDKENYDETIKAMENSHTDAQSAIMIVKGIELDLTKRTGKINDTICKNECSASGATIFVITEQQAAENSRDIEKMQKEGYKFIVRHAGIIGAESVIYDGAKIDASGLQDYNKSIKLLEGLRAKALAKGGISIKFNDDVYKMLAEAGINIWNKYGIIPVVNGESVYINGSIGRVEAEGITEQNIDSVLSKDSVMAIVVDNTEILSDRKDAIKEAKTAKDKQKKEYKAGLKVNIKYAIDASDETKIKELIGSISDILEEDLTEEAKPEDQAKREKVIRQIEQIRQSDFYKALNEKAKSRIDHLMNDRDSTQKIAAFIRVIVMRTAEERILTEMANNGIDIKTEEFKKFENGKFREAVLIRVVQLWLSGQDTMKLLTTEFIDSNMTAEEYMQSIMNKMEGIEGNIGRICIDNEYKISLLSDVAGAIAEFKEFNILLQDRFRQIGIDKEVKVSVFAVKSILSAA